MAVPPVSAQGAPGAPAARPAPDPQPGTAVASSGVGGATREAIAGTQEAIVATAAVRERAIHLAASWPQVGVVRGTALDALATRATLQAPLLARATAPTTTANPLISYRTAPGDTVWDLAHRFSVDQRTIWWANDIDQVQDLRRGQLLTLLPTSGVVHYVQEGETLDSIAHVYKAKAQAIVRANGLVGGVVMLGQRLLIPGGKGPRYAPRTSDSLTTGEVSLWPRRARHGPLPTIGAALLGDVAGLSSDGAGIKTMHGVAATPSTGAITGTDDGPIAEVGSAVRTSLRVLPGAGAVADQAPHRATSDSSPPVVHVRVIRLPGSGPTSPNVGATHSGGGLSIDRSNVPASGPPAHAAAIGPRPVQKVTIPSPAASASKPEATTPAPAFAPGAAGDVSRVVVDLSRLFTTQFDGSLFANTNCTMAAGAMLYEVQTGLDVSGAQMRSWSRDTTRYTSPIDLARAFAHQGQPLSVHYDMRWDAFVRQVRSGRSAVVMGWYGYLPAYLSQQPGFTGAHAIFVLTYSAHAFHGRGGFFVMDPLGRGGYTGQWWPASVLRDYAWSGIRGRHRSDRLSFYGDVAFQANRTPKRGKGVLMRPTFRDYWQTTKEVLDAAIQVTIRSHGQSAAGDALRGTLLIIDDAALRLSPGQAAATGALALPIGPAARSELRYDRADRSVAIVAAPGTAVHAAAAGRVVYVDWPGARGGQSVWVEHGPRLFTEYHGLDGIQVAAGQWVKAGATLGRVADAGNARSTLTFSVMVGPHPEHASSRVDPRRYVRGI